MSLSRTSTALGAFYRRLAARIGKAKAITAIARKLAVIIYRASSGRFVYHDPGAAGYYQLNRSRELKSLCKHQTRSPTTSSTVRLEKCSYMGILFLR